ncbi:hypothetical protein E4U15_000407 [Claviceps sp. LM218 group G6]|nr:hypothetical protein E4U15_000407 [Claviceps sp. LM218 group G6]
MAEVSSSAPECCPMLAYDGNDFAARQNIVVVTLNYRVGVFGFPGAPQLVPQERILGLLDQRLALDWVQRNIAAFGGNPRRITIFGESAGAGGVDMLVTSPPATDAMQSGQGHGSVGRSGAQFAAFVAYAHTDTQLLARRRTQRQ